MRGGILRPVVAGLVVLTAVVALQTSTSAARLPAVGSVSVYVGYADSYHGHANPDFPSPWAGDPGVTFEGCQPADRCDDDGGTVRIVDTSKVAVTVDAVALSVSTCEYTGWPQATLEPGSQLIVDQLQSGEGNGCTGPVPDHMDTSDIGPNGEPYKGDCTEDHVVPTVTVTVDGEPTTYLDSGQVLNTGGFDKGGCPAGTNESHPWTLLENEYVALGDSFSSGEGIAPYLSGTDVRGTNECHRSMRGYPPIVAKALGYRQFAFWACSGAVVADVWGTGGPSNPGVGTIGGVGQWNEQPQITHVNDHDSLVTISIGGNDIGFGELLKGCVVEGATYYAANAAIGHVNDTVIAYLNRRIADINSIINRANSINPFFDIPTIPNVPNVPLLTDPGDCLTAFPGMLSTLVNGGPERIYRVGSTTIGPCVPASCAPPPAGATVSNFVAPSLKQLYLQLAAQAAPGARIVVLAYPPIVNPAGVANPCSVGLRAPFSGTASASIHPFELVPLLDDLPGFLKKHVPTTISDSLSLRDTVNASLPAFFPTAVSHLLTAATQLNAGIQSAVAAAAAVDPNITFVNPIAQFSPPANSGRGGWFCNGPSTNLLGGPTTVSPFFNEGLVRESTLQISSVNLSLPSVSFTFGGVDPGSVHPNGRGARADACAILSVTVKDCGL